MKGIPRLSPVEEYASRLPRGRADWPGYQRVYRRLTLACLRMGKTKSLALSDEHARAMAVLGCGDEETMKAEQSRLAHRGFLRLEDAATDDDFQREFAEVAR